MEKKVKNINNKKSGKKSKKAVFVDIDQTLINGSTEFETIKYMLKKRYLNLIKLILYCCKHTLKITVKNLPKIDIYFYKYFKYEFKGLTTRQLNNITKEVFNIAIKHKFNHEVLDMIKNLKRKGYIIIILTGTNNYMAKHIARHIKADFVISSELENVKGILTGEIKGLHPFARNKELLAKNFAKNHSINLKQSYAFADHYTDKFILNSVGHPVVVNPKKRMLRYAANKGWKIIKNN